MLTKPMTDRGIKFEAEVQPTTSTSRRVSAKHSDRLLTEINFLLPFKLLHVNARFR